MPDDSKWASFVRAHRLSQNQHQSEFAIAMGVSQQTVSRWESGGQIPDASIQERLRTQLQTTALGSLAFWKRRISASRGYEILIARDMTILAASEKAERLLGDGSQSIVGVRFTDYLPEPSPGPGEHDGLNSIRQFTEIGFFDGLIRSIRLLIDWTSPRGAYSCRTDVWPVLTSDQTIVGHFSGTLVPVAAESASGTDVRVHDIDIQLNKDM